MSIQQIQVKEQRKSTPKTIPVRQQKKSSAKQKAIQGHLDKLKNLHRSRRDNTLFCRHELKYRIRETKARAIAHYIQSYIAADQYSRKCPDNQYPISSLYFDSDQLHLCQETMDKKTNRFKLRIRCYDANPQSPCFVEIKRRLNSVILKGRARLSKDMVQSVLQGDSIPDTLYKKDQDIIRQFQFYLRVLQARPIVLVRYMRQAFEDDSQNRVRVTFDRNLSFKTVNDPVVTTNGTGWTTVPLDFVILEIKFTNYYPVWLNDLVKIFDLKQTSMSKYVSTVKQSCSMGYYSPRCQIGV